MALILFYAFVNHLSDYPFVWCVKLKNLLLKSIFNKCGYGGYASRGTYFGTGVGIKLGDNHLLVFILVLLLSIVMERSSL